MADKIKIMMADKVKFVLFTVGLATAIGSAITSMIILYRSMCGGISMVHEPNSILAFAEIMFLILSVGTCVAASEVYYKYLEAKNHKQKTQSSLTASS